MKDLLPILVLIFISASCVPNKSEIKISMNQEKKSTLQETSVSSVQILNNQLVINGAGLSAVSKVVVNGNGLNENFTIDSRTSGKIIANSIRAFSFDVSKVFNLILSDANAASATFTIDFNLCNSTLHNAGFDCTTTVNDNDVLTYNQTDNLWVPRSLNGLSYQGSWDSTTTQPSATLNGQYWIVSVASGQYQVGDWIIWKSSTSTFNHITYSSVVVAGVSTVFGRSGAVVAREGDYTLDQLADVSVVTPTNGQILKFNGSAWIAADESLGNPGSVTTTELADGSVTNAKIDSVASTKITGTITSAQIADGAIVNADISSSAAIAYSKLNIADGEIPASKINGLPSGTATVANGGTGVSTLGLNQLLFGNGTSPVGTLATTTVPSVLLSTISTGAPVWTTSTPGNVLKGSVTGVMFGALSQADLPAGSLSGSGTTNYIPYYTAASTLNNSPITVSGSNVGIGTLTPDSTMVIASTQANGTAQPSRAGLIIEGEGTSFGGRIATRVYSSTEAPYYIGYRALGTKASPAALTSGKAIVNIIGYGFDGTNWSSNSSSPGISLETSQVWNATSKGSRISFGTVANGTTTTAERMLIDHSGNVGIGNSPGANTKLSVEGQIRSKSFSLTTGAVDWGDGNSGTTSFDCGSSLTFANLRDGGSYTLAVTGTGTTQCNFSTTTTGDDAGTVSYRFIPANAVRTASSHTIYSLQRIGTVVYVSWITGF